jgi:hypothetical protein
MGPHMGMAAAALKPGAPVNHARQASLATTRVENTTASFIDDKF